MAGRRRGKRRRSKSVDGFGQKLLVAVSGMILVLCVASIAYGVYVRHKERGSSASKFRIEVLNGTGVPGLAHKAQRGLRYLGIDVVAVDNAQRFDYDESVLIARKDGADVDMLGRLISCGNVVVQFNDAGRADATLVLGADYRRLRLHWGDD